MLNMVGKLLSKNLKMARSNSEIWDIVKWILAVGGTLIAVFVSTSVQGFSSRIDAIDKKTDNVFQVLLLRIDNMSRDSAVALTRADVLDTKLQALEIRMNDKISILEAKQCMK